jgi:hypothetical protein
LTFADWIAVVLVLSFSTYTLTATVWLPGNTDIAVPPQGGDPLESWTQIANFVTIGLAADPACTNKIEASTRTASGSMCRQRSLLAVLFPAKLLTSLLSNEAATRPVPEPQSVCQKGSSPERGTLGVETHTV